MKCRWCDVGYFLAWPIKTSVIVQHSVPLFQQAGKFIFKTSGLEDGDGHEQEIHLQAL